MSNHTRRATVATAAACLAILPLGVAAAASPPADTPALGAMAVGTGDIPTHSTITQEGSTRYPGAVAAYGRTIELSARAGRKAGFLFVDDTVALFEHRSRASAIFTGLRRLFRSRAGRRMLVREFGVSPRRVHIRSPRAVSAGDAAFIVGITVTGRGAPIQEALAFERVDRVLGVMTVAGIGPRAKLSHRTVGLLKVSAARIRAGLVPASLAPPAITGTPTPGAVASADPGTWSPATAPTSVGYQWQRCDSMGLCVPILGATAPTYTVAAQDTGATLRVAVTGSNSAGQTTVLSAPFGPIG